MLTARRSTLEDASYLAPRLRAADLAELRAGGRETPFEALASGLEQPDECFTLLSGDDPVAMFGTSPHPSLPEVGVVWLLGSDGLFDRMCDLMRATPRALDAMHARYPVLGNFVHAANSAHVRWLRWAGFSFINRYDLPSGSFYEFVRIKHV